MRKCMPMIICFVVYVNVVVSMDIIPSKERCNLMKGLSLHLFEMVTEELNKNPGILLEYKKMTSQPYTALRAEGLSVAPIHEVVISDDIFALEFLLQQPQSAKEKIVEQVAEDTHYLPLCFTRSKGALKLLLKHGAKLSVKDREKRTLVQIALFGQCPPAWSIAHFLLKKKRSDINARLGRYKNTLLHEAVKKELPEIVVFLLNRGANPQVQNSQKISAQQLAMWSEHKEINTLFHSSYNHVGLTFDHAKYDQEDLSLHTAALEKNITNIECLICSGIDLTTKNNEGLTAFELVLKSKDNQCIALFKQSFATRFVNTDSYMPEYKKYKDFLINYFGINTAVDNSGTTLLHHAVVANKYDKCVMLLKNKADMNALMIGMSPLFVALTHQHFAIAALLLDSGATVSERLITLDLPKCIAVKVKEKFEQNRQSKNLVQ